MKEKIEKILSDIKKLKESKAENCRLPGNIFYLNDSDILCMDSSEGEARYLYEMDGLNLWAYSNGYINACEGNLTIFRTAAIQEETSVDFGAL